MTYKNHPILLIENQQTQYRKLHGKLGDFTVFPEPDKYEDFMKWVRIRVNSGYNELRRRTALDEIVKFIRDHHIRLLIIDYKISGNFDGLSGLDLANEIRTEAGIEGIQFLYLSRTPFNSKDLQKEAHKVKEEDWVEKGYAGMSILEDDYFEKFVKDKIIARLAPGKAHLLQQTIDELSAEPLFKGDFCIEWDALVNMLPRTAREETCIRKLHGMMYPPAGQRPPTNSELEHVFNEYNQRYGK